ncbi:MAG: hypothetical protein J6A04_00710 [Clostridia bacterium]|nr:hypothetical protein [Clostridia bacterium]
MRIRTIYLSFVFEHIGKRKVQKVTIRYGNKENMINDLLEGEEYILSILYKNKFWNKRFKDSYKLKTFLEDTLEENSILNVTLNKKYKYNVNLKLHYSSMFDGRKISDTYIWWENEDEYVKSIINAIKAKVNKYEDYKKRMEEANQKFDKYCLVIYPQKIPIDVSEEKIIKAIDDEIVNIGYNEISIQLWNKMVLIENKTL